MWVSYPIESHPGQDWHTISGPGHYTHNFGYDSAGNPTTFKGSSQSFNSNNQNTAYTFDNNGNPTTYKSTSCTYDVENRLTAYGSALTCGYRGDGLRAWKQPGGGAKTYFLYDGTDVVCELDSSGNLAAHSTYGAAGLVSRRVSSTTTYYAFDAHGSVSVTTDSNGDAVSKHAWDAYGTSIGSAPSGPYGYGAQWGYYTDRETGVQCLTFRFYDPERGRFLTRDTIGYAGGVNLYGYVGNGPAGAVDPLGLVFGPLSDWYQRYRAILDLLYITITLVRASCGSRPGRCLSSPPLSAKPSPAREAGLAGSPLVLVVQRVPPEWAPPEPGLGEQARHRHH